MTLWLKKFFLRSRRDLFKDNLFALLESKAAETWTFLRTGLTGVPVFRPKGQRSRLGLGFRASFGGCLYVVSALGWRFSLVFKRLSETSACTLLLCRVCSFYNAVCWDSTATTTTTTTTTHCSLLGSHGRLKTSNCLISSRWILKINGFGLHSHRSATAYESENEQYSSTHDANMSFSVFFLFFVVI